MQLTTWTPVQPAEFIGKARIIAETVFRNIDNLTDNSVVKWFFTGPPGVGKSALAMLAARRLATHSINLEHLNGASLRIDVVRQWMVDFRFRPFPSKYSVKLVDEVDKASAEALDQIRTFLDTQPNYVAFIATTNKKLKELDAQLQTRLKPYYFESVPSRDIVSLLGRLEPRLPIPNMNMIAESAVGCVRAALIDAESWMEARA